MSLLRSRVRPTGPMQLRKLLCLGMNRKRKFRKECKVAEQLGFSVRIFIPNGEPEGLRVIEKSNWIGHGLSFPRSLYDDVKSREELTRTGVYILWGPGKSGQMPKAYIGEGDYLLRRLRAHHADKGFWTHSVVFTSKDESLNKAHVQRIEARLVELASNAKRCELDNQNTPNSPSLSEADKVDAELFLADMLLCLPVLGVTFFESPNTKPRPSRKLFLSGKGIEAEGYEDPSGFIVQRGSKAVIDDVPQLSPNLKELRSTLKSNGILAHEGEVLNLTQDYAFNSPSNAASALLGRSANGRIEWKDVNGQTLKNIQDAAIEEPI